MELTEKALRIAVTAHKDQVRKSDGSPYIVHPIMVGMLLADQGFAEPVVAAGFVHDVLEDTDMTVQELTQELGSEVATYVTAVSEDTSLQWEARKEQYADNVAAAPEGAKAVCIADKIHNAQSILHDYETKGATVWEVFNRGKEKKLWFEELVYEKVSATWQHPLLQQYRDCIDRLQQLN